jgi:hypothetical protein
MPDSVSFSNACVAPSIMESDGNVSEGNLNVCKADGLSGSLGLYEVTAHGQTQYMTEQEIGTRFANSPSQESVQSPVAGFSGGSPAGSSPGPIVQSPVAGFTGGPMNCSSYHLPAESAETQDNPLNLNRAGLRSDEDAVVPRPSYDNGQAAVFALYGKTKFAELVEAGQACAACHMAVAAGHTPTNEEVNLNQYSRVAYTTVAAREVLMAGLSIGERWVATSPSALAKGGESPRLAAGDEGAPATNSTGTTPATKAPVTEAEGPKIVQGSSSLVSAEKDAVTQDGTFAMANRTGYEPTPLGKGTLAATDEVTLVAHGNANQVALGNKAVSPQKLADELVAAGWKGGTVRLAACQTGIGGDASYGQQLANALDARGATSVVIAPEGSVTLLSGAHGLPQVRSVGASNLAPPGEGWQYYTPK